MLYKRRTVIKPVRKAYGFTILCGVDRVRVLYVTALSIPVRRNKCDFYRFLPVVSSFYRYRSAQKVE